MSQNNMHASQARQNAETYNANTLSTELKSIFAKIKVASEKGEFSIEVRSIKQETRNELKKHGYKVVDSSDPRDNFTEWSIMWV